MTCVSKMGADFVESKNTKGEVQEEILLPTCADWLPFILLSVGVFVLPSPTSPTLPSSPSQSGKGGSNTKQVSEVPRAKRKKKRNRSDSSSQQPQGSNVSFHSISEWQYDDDLKITDVQVLLSLDEYIVQKVRQLHFGLCCLIMNGDFRTVLISCSLSLRLCPCAAGCSPPSMPSIVVCLMLSFSRWFPSPLPYHRAIFYLVVLLIFSLSLVATLCNTWSICCLSFSLYV